MNSIKYTYSICFCIFALIFFITSSKVFAKEYNFANINSVALKQTYFAQLINKNKIKNNGQVAYFKLLNNQEIYKLAFFTVENINISDLNHITVGNDKNLPFSDSRIFNKADYNNLILIKKA